MGTPATTSFDLYVWHGPRDLDGEQAGQLVQGWLEDGADPARSPFDRSTDVGWFYRELVGDVPDIDALTDAIPTGKAPIWASATEEPPARIVAIRFPHPPPADVLESIAGLAAKYDLIVFEPQRGVVTRPLAVLAAAADAAFWPRGAIRAGIAGGAGIAVVIGAWVAGIPILSGLAIVVGAFLFLMAVVTFVHAARVALRRARRGAARR